jgi:hypothetical protein
MDSSKSCCCLASQLGHPVSKGSFATCTWQQCGVFKRGSNSRALRLARQGSWTPAHKTLKERAEHARQGQVAGPLPTRL